jgi:hypothetical protein
MWKIGLKTLSIFRCLLFIAIQQIFGYKLAFQRIQARDINCYWSNWQEASMHYGIDILAETTYTLLRVDTQSSFQRLCGAMTIVVNTLNSQKTFRLYHDHACGAAKFYSMGSAFQKRGRRTIKSLLHATLYLRPFSSLGCHQPVKNKRSILFRSVYSFVICLLSPRTEIDCIVA